LDYETTGFNPYKGDKIFSFVLTTSDLKSKIYRFDNVSPAINIFSKLRLKQIHAGNHTLIAHNAKFEMGFSAMHFGGELPNTYWHDTWIMSKLLKNLIPKHSLELLANKYFRHDFPEEVKRWNHYDKEVKTHLTTQKRLMNNIHPE